ncbi:Fucoxanthin-chlorophyll a-c binding protein A, chloroplastic, partial [Symbiodinium microadriaticum]
MVIIITITIITITMTIASVACTGYIIQEFFRFPGYLSPSSEIKFADIPNGLAAVTKVPAVGWFQYTIFCGLCDLWLANQAQTNPPGKLGTRFWGRLPRREW